MVSRKIALALVLVASSGLASAQDEDGASSRTTEPASFGDGPWVLLSPEWMPLVTAGYRVAIHREPDASYGTETTTFHGFSFGLLAPLVATGRTDSRHRLAFGAGLLADFGVHDPRNPNRPVPPRHAGTYDPVRVSYVAGQLGLIWRAGGRTALLASAVWLPSRRRKLSTYVDLTERVLGRGRLSMGVVSRRFHVAVFVGFEDRPFVLPRSSVRPRRREGRAQAWDAGLVIGSGW